MARRGTQQHALIQQSHGATARMQTDRSDSVDERVRRRHALRAQEHRQIQNLSNTIHNRQAPRVRTGGRTRAWENARRRTESPFATFWPASLSSKTLLDSAALISAISALGSWHTSDSTAAGNTNEAGFQQREADHRRTRNATRSSHTRGSHNRIANTGPTSGRGDGQALRQHRNEREQVGRLEPQPARRSLQVHGTPTQSANQAKQRSD